MSTNTRVKLDVTLGLPGGTVARITCDNLHGHAERYGAHLMLLAPSSEGSDGGGYVPPECCTATLKLPDLDALMAALQDARALMVPATLPPIAPGVDFK